MVGEILQSLLRLSVQAIFVFDAELLIGDPVSDECGRLFGQDVRGLDSANLLFGTGPAADDFRQGLALVFAGKVSPAVVFDLLEKEIDYAGRRVRLDYAFIDDHCVLVTATDITRERRFQDISRRDLERRFAVLKAVSHRAYFAAFTADARRLFVALSREEDPTTACRDVEGLARELHTFKGNAGFFDFPDTVEAAQHLESHLEEIRVLGNGKKIKELSLVLKKDYFSELRKISDILGERWLHEADCISVPKSHYRKIEAWIRQQHPDDKGLAATLARYRREPFRELFLRFPEMASSLAERLGKKIHPLMIEGGDFPVIPERYQKLAAILVHLLLNALDHGIEPPNEREDSGKPATGSLRIKLERDAGRIKVAISDDGRGIDCIKVRQRASELGLDISRLDDSDASTMQVLFHQGYSTTSTISDISGRGIGLAAVKAEIDRIGASIQVHSRLGRGTTFEITIPESRKVADSKEQHES